VQLLGDSDGLPLVQLGSGGGQLLEAVRSQHLAYLSSQLILAWP
jgi:hypothetical protein